MIRTFLRHKVAGNLLMAIMLLSGAIALGKLNSQINPDVGSEQIIVTIEWPGASADDVDRSIIEAVEPTIRYLDGVTGVSARAREGIAQLFVEYRLNFDMTAAQSDIETALRNIRTLPEEAEEPVIVREEFLDQIMQIVVSGPVSELALRSLAKRIENDLRRRGVDRVLLNGAREREIWVEVPARTLERLDLTLDDVAGRIHQASRDLPSGNLSGSIEKQVRSIGQQQDAAGIETLTVSTDESGRRLTLGDIATVRETFEEGVVTGRRDGNPAIQITVARAKSGDVLYLTGVVNRYLEELRPTLPPNIKLETYNATSQDLQDRVSLLISNGIAGCILVVAVLALFLRPRVTLWVAASIPISLAVAFVVMLILGQTINMLSLFALIMVLGIITDDSIVVAEHAQYLRQQGMPPLRAAELGARRMLVPVMAASITTICAFAPMLLLTGEAGAYVEPIPMIAIAVVVASLVECFLVLPGHLRSAMEKDEQPSRYRLVRVAADRLERLRLGIDRWFVEFRDARFLGWVGQALDYRYATVAAAISLLLVTIGLQAGGRLPFHFMPSPESQWMHMNVVFSPGTPRSVVEQQLDMAEDALARVERNLGYDEDGLVRMAVGQVGATLGSQVVDQVGDFIGAMQVEVIPADQRDQRLPDILELWEREVELLPGVDTIVFSQQEVGLGNPGLGFRLTHDDPQVLKQASLELQRVLATFDGVSGLRDNLPLGKPELLVNVTPRGEALGFTTESVSRQLRSALDGAIAKRFASGDGEVTVRVRLPEADQTEEALRNLYLRSPSGAEVPLAEVVELEERRGLGRIFRDSGDRTVVVFAQVDLRVVSVGEVRRAIERDHLPAIMEKYGVKRSALDFSGDEEIFFMDFMRNVVLGLAGIYFAMVWALGSFSRPIAIVCMVPFGVVGAAFGHWILGYPINLLSYVAVMGLAGILVNDAIILIQSIQDNENKGLPLREAVIEGSRERLRPVILTSLTTIGGLLPLLLETNLQAQFLVPMAITICFGLATSTVLVIFLVPAMLMIGRDIRAATGRMAGRVGRRLSVVWAWIATPTVRERRDP